eukprot:Awhi_evm1s8540
MFHETYCETSLEVIDDSLAWIAARLHNYLNNCKTSCDQAKTTSYIVVQDKSSAIGTCNKSSCNQNYKMCFGMSPKFINPYRTSVG